MRDTLWLLLPLPVLAAAILLLGGDAGFFLIWWLAFAIIGWLAWPLAARLFPGGDDGYLLAKPLGLAASSLLLWTLSYLKIMPFQRWSIILTLAAIGSVIWLPKAGWKLIVMPSADRGRLRRAAAGELLFGSALLLWTFARGLKPEIDGLEKFMNIGFMNALWRTDFLPALDMWLAGEKINYYYFGQFVYTFLARLVNIRPEISYNLGMAATFALTFSLSYAVASQILAFLRRHQPRLMSFIPATGGLLAAFLVTVAGNGHSFLYDKASPAHGLMLRLNETGLVGGFVGNPFWFADSTRFIGYNPNTADKTIHEFPFYSFLVADLHAHVINLTFVLLLIALLVRLISDSALVGSALRCLLGQQDNQAKTDREWHRAELRDVWRRFRTTAANGPLLAIIGLLAISMMGNFWDFAVYFAVTTLILMIVNFQGYGRIRLSGVPFFILQCVLILIPFLGVDNSWLAIVLFAAVLLINHYITLMAGDALTLTGAQMSWIFFLAHLVTLPFNIHFDPISKQLALAVDRTPLWQLLVLWGPHVLAAMLLIGFILITRKRGCWPKNPADLLMVALAISGIILIVLPELFYVVDIYSGEFKRANTMFKFTYQAFVLLSLAWSYALARIGIYWLFLRRRFPVPGEKRPPGPLSWPAGLLFIILIVCLTSPAWYPLPASRQWLGSFTVERYKGLDGLLPMAGKNSPQINGDSPGEMAADYAAILWFNENVSGQPVILEAAGESYTDFGRISAFTGLPAVMGWETHQWLWRTSKTTPDAYGSVVWPRQQDVRTMYVTADQAERLKLIEKYQVAYVIIGDLERNKYSVRLEDDSRQSIVREDLLLELGEIVFQQDNLMVIKLTFQG